MTYKGETRILETSVPTQGLREMFKALKGGEGGDRKSMVGRRFWKAVPVCLLQGPLS